jgi:hypothetical protein
VTPERERIFRCYLDTIIRLTTHGNRGASELIRDMDHVHEVAISARDLVASVSNHTTTESA